MRNSLAALASLAVVALVVAPPAGGDRGTTRVNMSQGLSVRVPLGWHVLHGWLSDTVDPAPRLAVASFPARLSRRTCACGFPNVVRFPRNGAFVFVWEYLDPSGRLLARTSSRPVRFHLVAGESVRETCTATTDVFAFKAAGRVFQVEVYLGPAVTPALHHRVEAVLDSLRVAPSSRS